MIDTWTFYLQMRLFFIDGNGKNMFGPQTHLALVASDSLERDIRKLLRAFTRADQSEDFNTLVEDYAAANPLLGITFTRESAATTTLQVWKSRWCEEKLAWSRECISEISPAITWNEGLAPFSTLGSIDFKGDWGIFRT
jgi:hypothetical protein